MGYNSNLPKSSANGTNNKKSSNKSTKSGLLLFFAWLPLVLTTLMIVVKLQPSEDAIVNMFFWFPLLAVCLLGSVVLCVILLKLRSKL